MAKDRVQPMNLLFLPALKDLGVTRWSPPVDVYRGPSGWLVKIDLAGVRPEEIQVTAQRGRLWVRGRRRDWSIAEGYEHHSMEISYSHFERSIDLPCPVGQCRILPEYSEGMLLIRIRPKSKEAWR